MKQISAWEVITLPRRTGKTPSDARLPVYQLKGLAEKLLSGHKFWNCTVLTSRRTITATSKNRLTEPTWRPNTCSVKRTILQHFRVSALRGLSLQTCRRLGQPLKGARSLAHQILDQYLTDDDTSSVDDPIIVLFELKPFCGVQ
ncbi:hypothetical protein EVAR_19439_1 [Eumeta japonica]|uniref:Uncharacterized protein n=1 Tax=Eumeta variegata TaxID=151549 RepID=A0A4C1TRM6_EUMVA|nr:hypothetical protein EVAR_19439_1 [Eumeta japonica]